MEPRPRRKIGSDAARFLRDERGVLPVLALLLFVMLIAVGGLAVDLGRLYGERGQMQSYVDHAALSAASQLDGQSDAIDRAFKAVKDAQNRLISGDGWQNIATQNSLDLERIMFLSALGADPGPTAPTPAAGDAVSCTWQSGTWTPASCNTSVSINKNARFVEVRSEQRTVSYFILPIVDVIGKLFGAEAMASEQGIGLRATAGFKSETCDINPIMICNPEYPDSDEFHVQNWIGHQILMKEKGQGAAWGKGDFGLLNIPSDAGDNGECNGNGASRVRCLLALVDPKTHCTSGHVTNLSTSPGQESATSDGLKVRFDIYEGNLQSKSTDPKFAPSKNVTKGVCKLSGNGSSGSCNYNGGNACPNLNQMNLDPTNGNGSKQLVRLPRDLSWDNSGRFGSGCWYAYTGQSKPASCPGSLAWPPAGQASYWSVNHPSETYPSNLIGTAPTRYQMYSYEMGFLDGTPHVPNKSGAGGEDGRRRCATSEISNKKRDRRTLIMAVVNCSSDMSGRSNVPVVAYVKVFLSEPPGLDATGAPAANVNDVYGEVINKVNPGDESGTFHVLPVLYR